MTIVDTIDSGRIIEIEIHRHPDWTPASTCEFPTRLTVMLAGIRFETMFKTSSLAYAAAKRIASKLRLIKLPASSIWRSRK